MSAKMHNYPSSASKRSTLNPRLTCCQDQKRHFPHTLKVFILKRYGCDGKFRYTAARMKLNHLRYFTAVAEDLSFTKAARRLKMAQPPLSRQIRSLEAEIGVQLFERRSGKVLLTDAGCRFLPAVRLALEQIEAAVDVVRQTKDGELGTVRVGFGKGLGDVVSLVINQHMRFFPKIEVDVRDILSGHQIEALLGRKIDVGFSHGPPTSRDLASEKLFAESLSIVLARSNALSKRPYLRLKDLSHQTLLLIERWISPNVHDLAVTLCRDAGLSPRIVLTESTIYDEVGAMMAASGKGVFIAVGKNPCHPSFADQLVALNLREPLATLEVHAAWRKGESSSTILNFIETTRTLLQRGGRVLDMRNFPGRLPVTREQSRGAAVIQRKSRKLP